MDSLTHIALGAAAGELMLGKKLGKRAMVLGAIANSFPDIDFVAAMGLSPTDNLLVHRGFTHSFLCIALLTIFFTWLAIRLDKNKLVSTKGWILFIGTQLALHLLVDAFNAYGVGWFIPFDDSRISFHTIFVFDPFYSAVLFFGLILLILLPVTKSMRIKIALGSLIISTCYLVYGVYNKLSVNEEVKQLLAKQEIIFTRYFTTPTPLNTWLWFVVAEQDSGYHIGYRSVFDDSETMPMTYVAKNEYLLQASSDTHDLKQLKKFSQGYYTAETRGDTLIFNDLRFGQITGWHNVRAPFAFHYYLNYPEENLLVMQRGRFANWNETTVKALITRIQGE
jgi:inner membrane protein